MPVQTPQAPQEVDATTKGSDVRAHYTVEAYDVEFTFNPSGVIEHVLSSVEIRAASDDVRYYFTGHAADDNGEPSEGHRVAALSGAALERINVGPLGAADMYFRLDRPLLREDPDPYKLVYEVYPNLDNAADTSIMYVAPPGAKRHRLLAHFAAPMVPSSIWWFAAPDSFGADRPEPASHMSASSDLRYEQEFNGLLPGWCYGFTWRW